MEAIRLGDDGGRNIEIRVGLGQCLHKRRPQPTEPRPTLTTTVAAPPPPPSLAVLPTYLRAFANTTDQSAVERNDSPACTSRRGAMQRGGYVFYDLQSNDGGSSGRSSQVEMDIDYEDEAQENESLANESPDGSLKGNGQATNLRISNNDGVDLSLVKDHWTSMGKDNAQSTIIHNMFFHMFTEHPHIRPIWAFNRTLSIKDADWKTKLGNNHQFRHHCASVQAAITLVTHNIDNIRVLSKTLEDVGSHHFFYDAYEPHLEIVQEGIIAAMRQLPSGPHSLHPRLEEAWVEVFGVIKSFIATGIEIQRAKYLAQCVTPDEMVEIRAMWVRVNAHGLHDAGLNLCGGALQAYNALIKQYELTSSIQIDQQSEEFRSFSVDTIEALSTTIDSYQENGVQGFGNLPNRLKAYVQRYVITDVCPTLVRKAFMEGLINMLTYVLGEMDMTETVQQTWSKIYRVMEQAIIANIVKY
uniref:Globin family profile domain-containing protein n=1 Tax=Plectus sambesii TaxID=2011161 RepID=A0A914VYF8_9BILA